MTDEFWGEPIHVYTRKQAIADGVLVDLMQPETAQAVRQAGFRFPVATTVEVFGECIALTPAAKRACNDLQGRLWDVLWMLKCAIDRLPEGQPADVIRFEVYCVVDRIRPKRVNLKAVCGPDDNGSPCITIMYPEQD